MSKNLQILSTITSQNTVEINLVDGEMPTPGAGEVLVRLEAAPINPSDLAVMHLAADLAGARATGTAESPAITADFPPALLGVVQTRIDVATPVGSEGAGVVVTAGDSPAAQALMGKIVSFAAGGTYAQYRCVNARQCMPMPEGVSAAQAASSFVNPMTALGFVETMRMEGHKALVNTAAASQLGVMLNRICLTDGIDLVNIVRKPEQEKTLRDLGAKYVVNSSSESFRKDLVKALAGTGATIAFDAVGGGVLGSTILECMEYVAAQSMPKYDHYGSTVPKKLYIYGALDYRPIVLNRGLGFAWETGGWMLMNFMAKAGQEVVGRMAMRVATEITTTFATQYTAEISLQEALQLDIFLAYNRQATGEKYLITPQV